jgi:hypothetical protein
MLEGAALELAAREEGVTALGSTKILRNNRRTFLVVRKELCDRKAETLVDMEEAARWWRYNFVL